MGTPPENQDESQEAERTGCQHGHPQSNRTVTLEVMPEVFKEYK